VGLVDRFARRRASIVAAIGRPISRVVAGSGTDVVPIWRVKLSWWSLLPQVQT
jgi:hypothetical protein